MFNQQSNLYGQATGSGRKKIIVLAVIGVVVMVVVSLGALLSSKNNSPANKLVVYTNEDFSILKPSEYSTNSNNQDVLFQKDLNEKNPTDYLAVSKYVKTSDKTTIASFEQLNKKSGLVISKKKINNNDVLVVKNATTNQTNAYVFDRSYVWLVSVGSSDKSGGLVNNLDNILKSFKPKDGI